MISELQKRLKFLGNTHWNFTRLYNFDMNFAISQLLANNYRSEKDILKWKSALKTAYAPLYGNLILCTVIY